MRIAHFNHFVNVADKPKSIEEQLRRGELIDVTAYAGKGDEDRIREAGADSFVSKPIALRGFLDAIDALAALADQRQGQAQDLG